MTEKMLKIIHKRINYGNDICKEIVEYMVLEMAYGIVYANDKHSSDLIITKVLPANFPSLYP